MLRVAVLQTHRHLFFFCLFFAFCCLPGSRVWARAGAGLSLLPARLGLVGDRRAHYGEGKHRSVAEGTPSAGIRQLPPCRDAEPCARVCMVGRGPGTAATAGTWAVHAAAGLLPGQGPAPVTLAHAVPLFLGRLPGAGRGRRLQGPLGSPWRSS